MSESDRSKQLSPLPRNPNYGTSKVSQHTNSNDSKHIRRRVFIGNLDTTRADKKFVEDTFSKFGKIESISLHNNFGFVQFFDNEGADEAVLKMHGQTLHEKRIDVNLAGLRRKKNEGVKKDEVVPPHMVYAGAKPTGPNSKRRDRSPHRDDSADSRGNGGGRQKSPMSRYEELYARDDPYTRDRYEYPTHDRYGRDYPTDPYHRDPHAYREDAYQRPEYRPPPPAVRRPAIDCEIVSLSKEESRYAEDVESRLRSIGLVCNIGFPPVDVPVMDVVDRIARLGTLYAVVVAPQNAVHRSCTLNILHGPRQEHRNMPLDDCLSLVARNFDTYLKILRGEPAAPPPRAAPPPLQAAPPPHYPPSYGWREEPPLPARYAEPATKQMSNEEIEAMIEKLRREKEQREASAGAAPVSSQASYYPPSASEKPVY